MGKSLREFCAENSRDELLRQWDAEKNAPLESADLTVGSPRIAWRRCPKGHLYQAQGRGRVQGAGCPVCAGRVVLPDENSLAARYPALLPEWDMEKNAPLLPTQIAPRTMQKLWRRCSAGHSWRASVVSRTEGGTGCPVCAGRPMNRCTAIPNGYLADPAQDSSV